MKQALKMGLHDSKGKQSFLCALICVVVRDGNFVLEMKSMVRLSEGLVREPSVCLAKQQRCRHWFPVLPRHRCPCSA